MNKELFASLLVVLSLVVSVAASAAGIAAPRAASDKYCWQSFCNDDVETIFSIEGSRKPVKVLVYVNQIIPARGKLSRTVPSGSGAILEGCGRDPQVFVHPGQTVECTVRGDDHSITARSCDSNRVTGTIQLINI